MTTTPPPGDDPVLARRARIEALARVGSRLGYSLLAVAIVAFVVGAARGFTPAAVTVVVVTLAAGSVVLLPSIIAGYAVHAAEREERGEPSGH
ncbi:MAG: hypothetical protein ABR511_11910 [Acidimicrobiales bacterium]